MIALIKEDLSMDDQSDIQVVYQSDLKRSLIRMKASFCRKHADLSDQIIKSVEEKMAQLKSEGVIDGWSNFFPHLKSFWKQLHQEESSISDDFYPISGRFGDDFS